MQAMQQQGAQMFSQSLMKSLQDNAKIEDYRIEVWDKTSSSIIFSKYLKATFLEKKSLFYNIMQKY